MAQRIVTEKSCDWHEQLDTPVKLPAGHVRITPTGKEVDLCEGCCLLFDLGMPRVEVLVEFFKREVIERLLRSGREPEDGKRRRVPAQLAIPGSPSEPKQSTKKAVAKAEPETEPPPAQVRKKAQGNRGRWDPKVDQVLCPLDHKGANSPKEYWVEVRNRGSHAKSSHDLLGPQIPYKLPPEATFTLSVKCFEHKLCAEAGGFGFKNAAGLAMHIQKADSEGWEPAPSRDAAETSAPAA
ncbi:hypothetical protein DMB38_20605 [Streptomyces sp. WAC 06738]|uniref:hypothetical protein n=1 Tax=Streptomyces sp. WAC 06738 TaxID=2203210 RepID=UPI000F6F87C9|nr:hypothetical protein [Streptomyces sp. WAC 06738]AZM47872.1 hypothetical protein DMB38_20605 [Streptomyces sp. WAC 06738]